MAEHKVPQDVEADDKLIGPFGLRQFIYLLIAAAAGFVAFILGQIAVPLAIIPAPICLFFAFIALPLRKDQPTEVYLAALIKYYFKPRVRIWQADGEQPLIEISNPTTDDGPKTKDLAGDEVSRRLSFLATLSDTQGWSSRGLSAPINNTNLNDEFAGDATNAQDVMDDSEVSNSIDRLLNKSDRRIRQQAIDMMNQANRQANNQASMPTTPTSLPLAAPATPNLAATANLPTYDYNTVVPASQLPNLQSQTPQPVHNRHIQPLSTQSSTAQSPTAVNQTTNAAPDNNVATDAGGVSTPSPTPAVATVAPATRQVPNQQPVGQPAPTVSAPTKPAIIDDDSVVHQPRIDAPSDDNQSIIDIKLH